MKTEAVKSGEIIWLVDVIRVAVGTGLRIGELCALKWSAVNLTDKLIEVRVTDESQKSGHERIIPVSGDASGYIDAYSPAHILQLADVAEYTDLNRQRVGRTSKRFNDDAVRASAAR